MFRKALNSESLVCILGKRYEGKDVFCPDPADGCLYACCSVLARPAGKSNIIQLYLVEKDPSDWSIVEDGASGKLTYNKDTGEFVFNGHSLDPGVSYTLINFARVLSEWPATINVLGSGIAYGGGNVHIAGNYAYADLDWDTTPLTGSTAGYKIWLVLSSDIDANGKLAGWTPGEYLFEAELI